ncbi:MAG: hypothetical protein ACYCW6_12140 [Candidatus Xenobia bacterium]
MMLWNTLANALVPPKMPQVPEDEGWLDRLGLSPAQRMKLMPLVGRWRRRHQEACAVYQAAVEAKLEPRQQFRLRRVGDLSQVPLSEPQRAQLTALQADHQARLDAQRHAFQLLADSVLTSWQRKLLAELLAG